MTGPGTSTVKLPMPDQVIAGKYRIISRLGSGGMGLVFLAEQLPSTPLGANGGTKVALKFLDPEPSEDESRAQRFLREAKVALQVQHPGATQILDLGQDEAGRLYMCFELVEGEDLREVLKREGRLRLGEARSITVQVAEVLAFAHGRNIVHRDVKPENLRVRRDAQGIHVKVLDFGIARLLKDANVRLTAEGMLAGTPRYMSPEQVKDEAIDGRTDQYALGLVLFEMLTGAVAIGGKNITQILTHQLKTPVPSLSWVDPLLGNAELDAFIARTCAKEPGHRFVSMTELIAALQAIQVDEVGWPAAKAPPAVPGNTSSPTRQGEQPTPVAPPMREGESDTLVRVPARTDLEPQHEPERRSEVPTDPDREPVARRPAKERPTDPDRERSAGGPVKVAPPALELPTDPERPAVSRSKATVPSRSARPPDPARQKVICVAMPPPRTSRVGWGLFALVVLSGGAVAGWWWFTHWR